MSIPTPHPLTPAQKLAAFAGDIKIGHSVFALPWALLATFLAARGWPRIGQLLLIILCMVTARTVAMAANRVLDARLDKLNPRTAGRAIPSGRLAAGFVLSVLIFCAAAFITCTALFWIIYQNHWPLLLSAPVLLYLCGYPFMKRFTAFCHYYLGAALAIAPVCAWVAIRGDLSLTPWIMFLAVLTWTAGFDILYACQDYQSDLETGVFSVPARIGIPSALLVSRATHAIALGAIFWLGRYEPLLGPIYYCGATIAGILLIVEQSLVHADDLSKLGLAFFTLNGIISILLGTLGVIDVCLG